jgi:hypothetical protein
MAANACAARDTQPAAGSETLWAGSASFLWIQAANAATGPPAARASSNAARSPTLRRYAGTPAGTGAVALDVCDGVLVPVPVVVTDKGTGVDVLVVGVGPDGDPEWPLGPVWTVEETEGFVADGTAGPVPSG